MYCLVVFLTPQFTWAQSGVTVTNAWAGATVAAQKVGGVYMDIRSNAASRLLSASSPVAGRAEIHNMKIENGVMKMSPVEGIDVLAGKTVKLEPGGFHVMLVDLKRGLKAGETIPVTLTFEGSNKTRQTVEVKAEVKSMAGAHAGH